MRISFFELHPAAAAYAEQKYLRELLSFQLTHEALLRDWPKLYHDQPPSYSTTRRFLKSIPASVERVARPGTLRSVGADE